MQARELSEKRYVSFSTNEFDELKESALSIWALINNASYHIPMLDNMDEVKTI
jgi:hypothetical protein|nr:hypothetical protein Q903MT_gene6199 [Picea sitchensis]